MNLQASGLIPALLLLAAAVVWWMSALQAREAARADARRFCRRQGWQLIDETVALASFRPRRSDRGWILERGWRFEFSPDGGRRCQGGVLRRGRTGRIWADAPEGRIIEDLPDRSRG